MKNQSHRAHQQLNTGSMADIAFLLLIFFLITMTFDSDKGLMIRLPQKLDQPINMEIHERNLFNILLNSNDEVMVEGELLRDFSTLKKDIIVFVLNRGRDKNLSDSPEDAVVSIKTNRGTSYKQYVKILDQVQAAYYEIYAERVGLTPEVFRALDQSDPKQKALYVKARRGIPMNVSIAKPSNQ